MSWPKPFPRDRTRRISSHERACCSSAGATRGALSLAHSGPDGVRELVIIRNGYLIWEGEDVDKVHGVWSCTKSFTSTVLGLPIDDGKCTLETKAAEILSELAKNYPELTLEHFTTMAKDREVARRLLNLWGLHGEGGQVPTTRSQPRGNQERPMDTATAWTRALHAPALKSVSGRAPAAARCPQRLGRPAASRPAPGRLHGSSYMALRR